MGHKCDQIGGISGRKSFEFRWKPSSRLTSVCRHHGVLSSFWETCIYNNSYNKRVEQTRQLMYSDNEHGVCKAVGSNTSIKKFKILNLNGSVRLTEEIVQTECSKFKRFLKYHEIVLLFRRWKCDWSFAATETIYVRRDAILLCILFF